MSVPKVVLVRHTEKNGATLGTLEIGGPIYQIFATLEPAPPVIPQGVFPLLNEYSGKFRRYLWELRKVPGHTELKIHHGNVPADTEGCVLIGMRHGTLNGLPAVLNSRWALSALTQALEPYKELELKIEVVDGVGE